MERESKRTKGEVELPAEGVIELECEISVESGVEEVGVEVEGKKEPVIVDEGQVDP